MAKVIELFTPGERYTRSQVQKILSDNNKKQVLLWPQVWGWDLLFSTEPTHATPAGSHRKCIKAND